MTWKFEIPKPNTAVCIGIAGVSLLAVRRVILYFTTRCPSRAWMKGKTVIVTGANCGIGYETALELARREARVILACRDVNAGQEAVEKIVKLSNNDQVILKKLDLASFASVRAFCKDISSSEAKLDVLVNNAAVFGCPYALTEDGIETHMSVNHFGNVLLTQMLLDLLKKSDSSRVVFVTSTLLKFGTVDLETINSKERYAKKKSYHDSKLLNMLYVRELQNKVKANSNISLFCVSPGMVVTRLGRYNMLFSTYFKILAFPVYLLLCTVFRLLVKTAKEGCQTIVYCAVAPEVEGQTDGYYSNFTIKPWFDNVKDPELAKKVYDYSTKVTGI